MTELVRYKLDGGVATITMDDGKVNALSPSMLAAIGNALDRAALDDAVVVLRGRDGTFSAGFDLKILRAGGDPARAMVLGGFELSLRMLAFPRPVVMAATGHAIAMGLFLLLSGDYRVGGSGPVKFTANEVAIGLTMPHAACEILRQRLTPAAFNRAVLLAETFTPATAIEAGVLDRVVEPDRVVDVARELAEACLMLDRAAHAASKLRARQSTLAALRAAIDADAAAPIV